MDTCTLWYFTFKLRSIISSQTEEVVLSNFAPSVHKLTKQTVSIHYNKLALFIVVKGKLAEKSESFLIKVNGGSRRGGGGAIIMHAAMKRQEPCTINATQLFAYPTLVNACIYPHLYS
jgi:hypothetical protein